MYYCILYYIYILYYIAKKPFDNPGARLPSSVTYAHGGVCRMVRANCVAEGRSAYMSHTFHQLRSDALRSEGILSQETACVALRESMRLFLFFSFRRKPAAVSVRMRALRSLPFSLFSNSLTRSVLLYLWPPTGWHT